MSKSDALQRNLQLILRDRQRRGWQLEPPAPGTLTDMVDFGSNDTLSLSSSGLLGKQFLKELGKYPNFILGGRASRWGEGSTEYLLQLEEYIAKFHKAESALFFQTGMDGDAAPLEAIVREVKEQLPHGNAVFVIDEAHSTGLVGPQGSGLVSHLGLKKEFSIRVHTFGKAHGASGAVVLSSRECKQVLLSCVRGLIFSTAPTFTTLAAVKAGYSILASAEGERRRDLVRSNINLFYDSISKHVSWPSCQHLGIITVPVKPTPDTAMSPIIPIIAPHGGAAALGQFLSKERFRVLAVHFPVVPKDRERVRINLHADHTSDQTLSLVNLIIEWTQSRRRAGTSESHL
ncbi:8-amino-7-oxononanoate synthase [Fusarium napiforme]|uniref:8-amino-7-oxononanoate synthase n=1 Tax=Fusarium napiforme TaxID=42672 RepID=A0A8H5I9B5_9HYPO|nr:8-amino-7-oxononanoate synthase [Fusarium napiforme]